MLYRLGMEQQRIDVFTYRVCHVTPRGWLVCLLEVISACPGRSPRTRDDLRFDTASRVRLGEAAEFNGEGDDQLGEPIRISARSHSRTKTSSSDCGARYAALTRACARTRTLGDRSYPAWCGYCCSSSQTCFRCCLLCRLVSSVARDGNGQSPVAW
jgi:hypothetical protein